MLPSPREPLWLRPGEQNLHIPDAGFHPSGCPAASALCSPLPARPCGSVPGSKIFTQLPTPKRSFADKSAGPFAPLSPRTLVASSRGAKSSHSRRRFSPFRPPGGFRFLLPSPREPLWLRPGEQNLHIPDAGFHPSGCPAASALCSPLPAKPCISVPGSKIFTQLPAAERRSAGKSTRRLQKNRSRRTIRCSSFSRSQQITLSACFYSFLFFRLPASAARIAADAPIRPRYRSALLSSPVNGPILLLSSFPPCFPLGFGVTVFFLYRL